MGKEIDAIWRNLSSNEERIFFAIARYSGETFSRILQLRASDLYYCELNPREKILFQSGKSLNLFSVPEQLKNILIQFPIKINLPENKYIFPHKVKDDDHLAISTANSWITKACISAEKEAVSIRTKDVKIYILRELYNDGMSLKDLKILFKRTTNTMLSLRFANSKQTFEQIIKNEKIISGMFLGHDPMNI